MTKKYTIVFNKAYLKDLQKIPKKDQKKIEETIHLLANDPRPDGCKKLKSSPKLGPLYRVRSGDYRVVYMIKDDVLLVLIVEVGHRKEIY